MSDDIVDDRLTLLTYWMDLGGDIEAFSEWMSEPRRTIADAKAQLFAARRGRWASLFADTNPPADQLLDLYLEAPND